MKLKIKVTKQILEKSKNCGVTELNGFRGMSCAVALAVRDIFPEANIGAGEIWPFWPNQKVVIILPDNAKSFISRFDRTSPYGRTLINEMEFEIKIQNDVIDQINIDEIKPLLENHPTLELITS